MVLLLLLLLLVVVVVMMDHLLGWLEVNRQRTSKLCNYVAGYFRIFQVKTAAWMFNVLNWQFPVNISQLTPIFMFWFSHGRYLSPSNQHWSENLEYGPPATGTFSTGSLRCYSLLALHSNFTNQHAGLVTWYTVLMPHFGSCVFCLFSPLADGLDLLWWWFTDW